MRERELIDADDLLEQVEASMLNNNHTLGMLKMNHRAEHEHFRRMIMFARKIKVPDIDWAAFVENARLVNKFLDDLCNSRVDCEGDDKKRAEAVSRLMKRMLKELNGYDKNGA